MDSHWKVINQFKVYQVANNNMRPLPCLFSSLFLLVVLTSGQILLPANSTLLDAVQNPQAHDDNLTKAYASILQTHPELQSYYVTAVTSTVVNATGMDYYITLQSTNNTTILVVVSLEENVPSFFVSFLRVDPNNQQTPTPPAVTANPATPSETTSQQPPEAILVESSANIPTQSDRGPSSYALGGFRPLSNLNDTRLGIAEDFLQERHPHLINYQLQAVLYQVATGVNFQLLYKGLDSISKINATVFVGMDGVPIEGEFTVLCADNPILECTTELANQLYVGNQQAITRHPQLKSYLITSIFIEQKTATETTFMSTFDNTQKALRAIAEVTTSSSKPPKILSYYSYRY